MDEETLNAYSEFLKKHLELPCLLTGIEDFDWEEFYVMGPGSKKEYDKLKKENPSHTDTFELVSPEGEVDEDYGILVNVKRVSDKKVFVLPLVDLESKDNKSKNYQLLDDYSVWFVNFR